MKSNIPMNGGGNGVSFDAFANQFRGFMGNPIQIMAQHNINFPQGMSNNPDDMIQQLMNEGKMNQQMYNQLKQTAGQIRNNPMFRQMFGGRW